MAKQSWGWGAPVTQPHELPAKLGESRKPSSSSASTEPRGAMIHLTKSIVISTPAWAPALMIRNG